MKVVTETLLVIGSALFWLIVLPLAGVVRAGLTLFDEWQAFATHNGNAFALGQQHRI